MSHFSIGGPLSAYDAIDTINVLHAQLMRATMFSLGEQPDRVRTVITVVDRSEWLVEAITVRSTPIICRRVHGDSSPADCVMVVTSEASTHHAPRLTNRSLATVLAFDEALSLQVSIPTSRELVELHPLPAAVHTDDPSAHLKPGARVTSAPPLKQSSTIEYTRTLKLAQVTRCTRSARRAA